MKFGSPLDSGHGLPAWQPALRGRQPFGAAGQDDCCRGATWLWEGDLLEAHLGHGGVSGWIHM